MMHRGRNHILRPTLLAFLILAVPLPVARAQSPDRLILDKAFPVAFGRIGPVRELSDGRVMVADPLGQVLARIDFDSESADTLGRLGQGPQEYGQPEAVFPLLGDTTLLVDLGNARLTTVDPRGIFVRTLPMGQTTASGKLVVALPQGVDQSGRLYFRSEVQPMGSFPDSAALVRFDPGAGILDTLALLKVPELPPPPLPGGGGVLGKAAEPQDDWAVTPDGNVAVVRCRDYSIQWISPDGRIVAGPANRIRSVRIRDAEKEMWLEENALSRVSMQADPSGRVRIFRNDAEGGPGIMDRYEWPSAFPPAKPGRSRSSPDGELWVERYVAAGEDPLVDRFDRAGRKVGELRLPSGRRVAGFGQAVVFLVRTDDFGLEWIERYRIQS
jgi:hypothetical protein